MFVPESCAALRKEWGKVLTGVYVGRAIERRKF